MSDSDESSIQFHAENTPRASTYHHSPKSHDGMLESSMSFYPAASHRSASIHSQRDIPSRSLDQIQQLPAKPSIPLPPSVASSITFTPEAPHNVGYKSSIQPRAQTAEKFGSEFPLPHAAHSLEKIHTTKRLSLLAPSANLMAEHKHQELTNQHVQHFHPYNLSSLSRVEPTPTPAPDRGSEATLSPTVNEEKIFMNIHSNVFGELQFRKMGVNTKFSRLLKGLLIAARDHLQKQKRAPSLAQSPLPPPPMSAGDLYFLPSKAVVDTSATPMQYGIDVLHNSEENGLEIFFKYHPLGGTIPDDVTSHPVAVPLAEPARQANTQPTDGPSIIPPTKMPPPPTRVPSSRNSPMHNRSFGNRAASPPLVPRHRSPQKTEMPSIANLRETNQSNANINETIAQHNNNSNTNNNNNNNNNNNSQLIQSSTKTTIANVTFSANVSHKTSGRPRDTPHRRKPIHEPRTTSEFATSQLHVPWPNEIPFRAMLPETVPNLTNRSNFHLRKGADSQQNNLSKNGPGGDGGSGKFSKKSPPMSADISSVPLSLSPRPNNQQIQNQLQHELDNEIAKALSLLRLNGPRAVSSHSHHSQTSPRKKITHQANESSENSDEEYTLARHSVPSPRTEVAAVNAENNIVFNFHSQLMHQLKLDRLRATIKANNLHELDR